MSEKEKAIELIEFFKPIVYSHVGSGFLTGDHDEELILSNAKLCANKCVDEIQKYREVIEEEYDEDLYHAYGVEEYWDEVKQEIDNYGK